MKYNNAAYRLKKIRKKLNMTQMEFATSLDITQTTLSAYENERRNITDKMIVKLYAIHKVNPEFIKYGQEPIFIENDNIYDNKNPIYLNQTFRTLCKEQRLDEFTIKVLAELISMPIGHRKILKEYLTKIFN